jgi:hypothetical protein
MSTEQPGKCYNRRGGTASAFERRTTTSRIGIRASEASWRGVRLKLTRRRRGINQRLLHCASECHILERRDGAGREGKGDHGEGVVTATPAKFAIVPRLERVLSAWNMIRGDIANKPISREPRMLWFRPRYPGGVTPARETGTTLTSSKAGWNGTTVTRCIPRSTLALSAGWSRCIFMDQSFETIPVGNQMMRKKRCDSKRC